MISASTLPKLLETTLPGKSTENIKVLSDMAVQVATVAPDSVGFVKLFTPVSWKVNLKTGLIL